MVKVLASTVVDWCGQIGRELVRVVCHVQQYRPPVSVRPTTWIGTHSVRIIKTARTERSINRAAQEGFWPLVKKVERDPEISSKFAVFQHRETGRIEVIGDFRSHLDPNEYEAVIGWSDFYPYVTDKPFAAYLIPPDLEVGERVYVADLIENFGPGRPVG